MRTEFIGLYIFLEAKSLSCLYCKMCLTQISYRTVHSSLLIQMFLAKCYNFASIKRKKYNNIQMEFNWVCFIFYCYDINANIHNHFDRCDQSCHVYFLIFESPLHYLLFKLSIYWLWITFAIVSGFSWSRSIRKLQTVYL